MRGQKIYKKGAQGIERKSMQRGNDVKAAAALWTCGIGAMTNEMKRTTTQKGGDEGGGKRRKPCWKMDCDGAERIKFCMANAEDANEIGTVAKGN